MEAMNTLQRIDLSHVQDSLETQLGVEPPLALEATELYRKFLYLKMKYKGEKLVAPKLVDEAWHFHILDTEAYMQDCDTLFGGYMHHNPYPASGLHAQAWARTQELFLEEFGIDLASTTVGGLKIAARSL